MNSTKVESPIPLWLNIPPLYWAVSLGAGLLLHFGLGRPWLLPLPLPEIIALCILMLAGIVALWSFVCFRMAKTPWLPHQTPCAVVASGPYRFTRNPMYVSLLLLNIGIAYGTRGTLMLLAPLLFFVSMNFLLIPNEERQMEAEFGEAFRRYCRRVRRWM